MEHSDCRFVPLKIYNWSQAALTLTPNSHECILPWNPTVYCLVASFHAVAISTALEVHLQLFSTFKRWTTLYFWSILISCWGVISITISFLLVVFTPKRSDGVQVLQTVGWVAMVTGFSMILYSRLHLVLYDRRILRIILVIILGNGLLFHTPVIVAEFFPGALGAKLYKSISKMEIYFCVQEFCLSSLYTYIYWKLFRDQSSKREVKTTFYLLVGAQTVILGTDVVLTVLLYMDFFLPRLMILAFCSAVKVRFELLVLNRIADFGQHRESLARDLAVETGSGGGTLPSQDADLATPDLNLESQGPVFERRQEVSILHVDGPACPELLGPAKLGKGMATVGVEMTGRDSIDDLERRYLRRYEYSGEIV